jgi:hypothetical protein
MSADTSLNLPDSATSVEVCPKLTLPSVVSEVPKYTSYVGLEAAAGARQDATTLPLPRTTRSSRCAGKGNMMRLSAEGPSSSKALRKARASPSGPGVY